MKWFKRVRDWLFEKPRRECLFPSYADGLARAERLELGRLGTTTTTSNNTQTLTLDDLRAARERLENPVVNAYPPQLMREAERRNDIAHLTDNTPWFLPPSSYQGLYTMATLAEGPNTMQATACVARERLERQAADVLSSSVPAKPKREPPCEDFSEWLVAKYNKPKKDPVKAFTGRYADSVRIDDVAHTPEWVWENAHEAYVSVNP